MFVGHYSAAFATKAVKPRLPLWHLFVAVQLVDFVWAGLVLAGIEKVRLVKGFMPASILDLHYMPYTHSLPASIGWAIAAGLIYGLFLRKSEKVTAGLIIGAAVFSHWLLDLIAHGPDLLLYFGGPKVGLGLWNSMLWTMIVEIGGILIGGIIYMLVTRPKNLIGKFAPFLFVAFMIALQVYNHMPIDHPPSIPQFAITALIAYTLLAALAGLVDMTRHSD